MPIPDRADVVVAGAGPTGLMLATELLRHGLRPLVVDRAPAPSPLSRAIVVHARTLEILEAQGLAAPLVDAGVRLRRVHIRSRGRTLVDVGFDDLPTRYPFLLSVPQSATEALLAERVAALGGEVHRGVALEGFEPDEDGVSVQLTAGRVRASWLVGCDGAHSAVRKGLALPFAGHGYEERLVLADVAWDCGLPRDTLSTFLDDGALACFPLPDDRWRLIVLRTAAGDALDDEAAWREVVAVAQQRSGIAVPPHDPAWVAAFRIHARQVDRLRVGRVLLAGDAAHIHSPLGGQGMNLGLQDAHNLGWKLSLAHSQADAPAAVLDSYERERHPVAAQVLRATDAATRLGTSHSRLVRAVVGAVGGAIASVPAVTSRVVRSVAELDVAYPSSPIVRDVGPRTAFRAGDRPAGLPVGLGHVLLPLEGPQITPEGRRRLRLCAALARDAYPGRVEVRAPPEAFGVEGDGVVVVRPDGFVGLRAVPADPVALAEWLEGACGRPA
jgi:2-polyprenyl-6-methoxyphenol hydroxylase-like FAD-dependent oxidoreductase